MDTPADPADLEPEILDCLAKVVDPEIGLSIVDLGLVYRALRRPGAVEVAMTLTTQACPLGEMILDEARERLVERFGNEVRIDLQLVWEPMWTPDLMTDRGLERLGRPARSASRG